MASSHRDDTAASEIIDALHDRLHPDDLLLTPDCRRTTDPMTDPEKISSQEFLSTIESLARLEHLARATLHRMIAHRTQGLEPSLRQVAAVTGMSHSTIFRIERRERSETHAPNGEAL